MDVVVRLDGMRAADRWVAAWAEAAAASPELLGALAVASVFGLLAIVAAGLGEPTARRRHGHVAVVLGGLALAVAMQWVIGRPRPPGGVGTPPVPGFPSGHAAIAFGAAIYAVLGGRSRAWLGLAAMVAASRVGLAHHYVSDVVAGSGLGLGLGIGGHGFVTRSGHARWSALWAPQLGVAGCGVVLAYAGAVPPWIGGGGVDKILHLVLLGAPAFFLAARGHRVGLAIWVAVIVVEEIAQAWSPLRTLDPLDLLADGIGLAGFGWLGARARRRFAQDPQPGIPLMARPRQIER